MAVVVVFKADLGFVSLPVLFEMVLEVLQVEAKLVLETLKAELDVGLEALQVAAEVVLLVHT